MIMAQTTSPQVGMCCCRGLSPACPSTRQAISPMTMEGIAVAMGSPRAGTAMGTSRTRLMKGVKGFLGAAACPPERTFSDIGQPQRALLTGQHRHGDACYSLMTSKANVCALGPATTRVKELQMDHHSFAGAAQHLQMYPAVHEKSVWHGPDLVSFCYSQCDLFNAQAEECNT